MELERTFKEMCVCGGGVDGGSVSESLCEWMDILWVDGHLEILELFSFDRVSMNYRCKGIVRHQSDMEEIPSLYSLCLK